MEPVSPPLNMIKSMFLSGALSWCFFGVNIAQQYAYYLSYHRRDRWMIKTLAYVVFLLGATQTLSLTCAIWILLVESGRSSFLPIWFLLTGAPFNAVLSMLVQIFFAWRIWCLRRARVGCTIVSIIMLLSLCQCAAGITLFMLLVFSHSPTSQSPSDQKTAAQVWLISNCVCDVTIAVTMVISLRQIRKRSVFHGTATMLNRLITISVQSGSITATITVTELLLFLMVRDTVLHVLMMYVRGRMYTSVLLAALNSREVAHSAVSVSGHPPSALRFLGEQSTVALDGDNTLPNTRPGDATLSQAR